MHIHPPARIPTRRRTVVVVLLAGCLVLLAACGSPSGTVAPSVAASASAALAPTPAASAGGGNGGGADCAASRSAAEDVSLQMQLLYQADSADAWRRLADPSSPVPLDAARFARAVAVIGGQPGGADLAAKYQPIADLMTQAASSGDPWGDGSGPAAQAHAKAQAAFIDLGVALSTWLEGLGCTP